MCLLPTWADKKGCFLFTPPVSSGILNTCLLWRWGRRAAPRKVLPTSLPRWCWSIKRSIYSDPSSQRLASPNTHTSHHMQHVSRDGDWNVISPCVSPVWRRRQRRCDLTALSPVLSHLPHSHFSHLVDCLTGLRSNLSSVNCPPTKRFAEEKRFFFSFSSRISEAVN